MGFALQEPAPLLGMADAMDHVIHQSERLSFTEALEMYTVGAAFAAKADTRIGRLVEGAEADFVVLSHRGSAETITASALRASTPLQVFVHGRRVYQSDVSHEPKTKRFKAQADGAGKRGLLRAWRRGRCPCCLVFPAVQ